MDDADISERNREFMDREARFKSLKHTLAAIATGYCLFCGVEVEENRRWCDVNCRDDWQAENE